MTITRREMMALGGTALALHAVRIGVASAAETAAPAAEPASGLADAAAGCIAAGNACLQHCLDLLGKGDTSIAECSQTVRQMLAVCAAIGPLADAGSKHLKEAARLCLDVCTDCEAACRKHENHHAPCKRCADACARTIAEAKKVLG